METFKTARGRHIAVVGDPALLTLDRMTAIGDRFDSDTRIATVSIVAHPRYRTAFLRSSAPAGVLVAVAEDSFDLVGPLDESALQTWSRQASERGLWHDWWLTNAQDVARGVVVLEPSPLDVQESGDPSTARHLAMHETPAREGALSVTIDATWLGEHQTGAQVLTTEAIAALANDERVRRITLVGLAQLPEYAKHLAGSVELSAEPVRSDIVWYPNQIDQRVSIADARSLGRRVIVTYLDLIAYDIARYHGSAEAWAAYRALQRRIALTVDGITAISADVANRLLHEIPMLDPERVLALPLGLDHITAGTAPEAPGEDLQQVAEKLRGRTFVLVLGNDFRHKNRDFAIAVWDAVLAAGVDCDLVLAGLHVRGSSSKEAEDARLRGQRSAAAYTFGHVSSASRAWLLANAAAVLYPSSAEGFGFVPYEAAALGTPSTFTRFGPLAEISGLTDVPGRWSVEAYSDDLRRLLTDPAAARARVAGLGDAIAHHTWKRFASELVDFFIATSARPSVLTSALGDSAADSAALAALLSSRTWRLTAPLRSVGRRLRRRG
jgi:glycosyltransferase involved in cell wall biosynthesis